MSDILVALIGGALGGAIAYLVLHAHGERARFKAALEPVRADLDSLADSFDSWRKGYDRRLRERKNAPGDSESDDREEVDTSIPPANGLERAVRLERIRRGQ